MRLLESRGGRTRSGAGATMSLVVHAAIIAATALGTARAHDAVAAPPERLIPIPPYIYDPPTKAAPTTHVATGPRRPDSVPPGERVITVPTVIRDGLPPIDLSAWMREPRLRYDAAAEGYPVVLFSDLKRHDMGRANLARHEQRGVALAE